jgi:hypothetical protein
LRHSRKFEMIKNTINIYPYPPPPITDSPLQPLPTSAVAATGFEIFMGERLNY